MNLALAIVLMIVALILIVAVVVQQDKNSKLSGTIAGGADTFYSKDKGTRIDRMLGKVTAICGIVFVLAVLLVYIIQPDYTQSNSLVGDAWYTASGYYIQ